MGQSRGVCCGSDRGKVRIYDTVKQPSKVIVEDIQEHSTQVLVLTISLKIN